MAHAWNVVSPVLAVIGQGAAAAAAWNDHDLLQVSHSGNSTAGTTPSPLWHPVNAKAANGCMGAASSWWSLLGTVMTQ